jgi:tRNA (uracil-5-)-methyltransferase TRM9
MQKYIIERLNEINRQFYATTATDFDATRGQAWVGWLALLELMGSIERPIRVLDIGCGNGRFGLFLAEQGVPVALYHGVDNSPDLLAYAEQSLKGVIPYQLDERDVVLNPIDAGQYDLVVAFGLLHHVPSKAHRLDFVGRIAGHVVEGGTLCFACWRFYEFERFQKRVVEWSDDLKPHVEPHDYLLDWRRGETALRYCHYVDDVEQSELEAHVEALTALKFLTRFRADGFTGTVNAYSVLTGR